MDRVRRILIGFLGGVFACGVTRAAESTWEIRGEVVSLKPGEPEVVLLKVGGAHVLEVPLGSFSESQRAEILAKRGEGIPEPASESTGAPDIEAVANACRTAVEAADVYRLVLASPGGGGAAKASAETQLDQWVKRASQGETRLGKEWVKPEQAAAARLEAEGHVRQAIQMLRIGNAKVAEDELRKASRVDPASGAAEFIQGLAALMGPRGSVEKAAKFFREVVEREPDHGPALNNLALCDVGNRRLGTAAGYFREAATNVADPQVVIGNVACVIRLAADRRNRVAPKQVEDFTLLYRWLIDDLGLTPVDGATANFVYLSLTGVPLGPAGAFGPEAVTQPPTAGHAMRVGTGVVVAPTIVVVPSAVIANGGPLVVRSAGPAAQDVPAQIVATGGAVTVLRCEGLAAPAIPVAAAAPAPGGEIRVVRPRFQGDGSQPAKSVLGSVVAAPAADAAMPRLVYSVVGDRQASGGFLLDAAGRFVGFTARTPPVPTADPALHVATPVEAVWPLMREAKVTVDPADGGAVADPKKLAEAMVRVVVQVPPAAP